MQTEAVKRAQKKYDEKRKTSRTFFLVRFNKEEAEEIDRVIKEHKFQKNGLYS